MVVLQEFQRKFSYQEFQELFNNEYSLKIMIILSQMENSRGCAGDISSILDTHISTAKKYLELLYKYHFVEREFFPTQRGQPTYYTLKTRDIHVLLDLQALSQDLKSEYTIPDFYIREKAGYPQITYDFGERGEIKTIIIRKRTKARRHVTHRIELIKTESQLMRRLPHPTMPPQSFLEVCKKAQIIDYVVIKSLANFIQKLKKFGVVETFEKSNG